MGKRRSKPSIEADQRQDELDLPSCEGQNGTLDQPARNPTDIDRPSACGGDPHAAKGGDEAVRGGKSPGPAAEFHLPALSLGGAWEASSGLNIAGATTMRAVRFKRLTALAATVALAAALGAVAGSLATRGFDGSAAAARRANANEASFRLALDRMEQELGALRTTVEKSAQALDARTDRITERLDRSERAQAEPAHKLAKIGETLDRLERRTAQSAHAAAPAPTAAAADVTGSLGDGRVGAPDPRSGIVSGWMLVRARNGAALIEGRQGLVEIETGDILPGLGRVEAIRKQQGRWVVVTSRGLIVDR